MEYCLVLTNARVDLVLLNRLTSWLIPSPNLIAISVLTKVKLKCSKFASSPSIQLSSYFFKVLNIKQTFQSMLQQTTERLDNAILKCYN